MLCAAMRSVVCLLLPLVCGCTFTAWERVHKVAVGPRVRVEIEQQVRDGAVQPLGHAHPQKVASLGLGLFFLELRHVKERLFMKDLDQPVVSPRLVGELSEAIARGLASAGPDQRVRFRTNNPVTKLLLLPGGNITRGVAFVDPPGTLNIAFDLVADPISDDADRAPGWGDPTRRNISDVRLALPEGASFRTTPEGVERSMWVTLPIAQLAVLEQEHPQGLPGAANESKEKVPEPSAAGSDAEALERLRYLEELYQKGAISEEAYREQRAELLEER